MKPSGMLLLVPQCVSIRMCRLQHLRYIVGRTRHGTAGLWLDSLGTAVTGRPQGEPIEATGHDMVIEIKGAPVPHFASVTPSGSVWHRRSWMCELWI